MKGLLRTIIATGDGSHSIAIPEAGLTFHSKHGAIQESWHVFMEAGLNKAKDVFPHEPLNILEMGFGTGLNAFLTAIEATGHAPQPIHYTAIDACPLEIATTTLLNYPDHLGHEALFSGIHAAPWNANASLSTHFSLRKIAGDILSLELEQGFHLIYYDAFAPEAQPELWTEQLFHRLYNTLVPGGMLVTYCSKSAVRRALQSAGFTVQKLPGPPGKREMVRAIRVS